MKERGERVKSIKMIRQHCFSVSCTRLQIDNEYYTRENDTRQAAARITAVLSKSLPNTAGDHLSVPFRAHLDHRVPGGSQLVHLQGDQEEDEMAGEECH